MPLQPGLESNHLNKKFVYSWPIKVTNNKKQK